MEHSQEFYFRLGMLLAIVARLNGAKKIKWDGGSHEAKMFNECRWFLASELCPEKRDLLDPGTLGMARGG